MKGLPARQTHPETPSAASAEDRQRLLESHLVKGRSLMAKGDWRGARDEAAAAVRLDPLNPTARELEERAQAGLDKQQRLLEMFNEVRGLFEEKDYQSTLWKLYRLPREPVFGDLDLCIRNAWYNWGIASLKAGNVTDALQKISEALATDPDDHEAMKLRDFAESYTAKARDRSYFAFTDNLAIRRIDQK
jgi:tetratricopeptide (TPR) repeat protein